MCEADDSPQLPPGVLVTRHFWRKPMPLAAVLSALCSQEHANGDEGDAMACARALLGEIWEVAQEAPELNMSNFYIDEVSALNEAMIQIYLLLKPAMEPSEEDGLRERFDLTHKPAES